MENWRSILEGQLQNFPPELSVEDAAEIYSNAPLNDLMFVAMERRRTQVPGKLVTYMIDRNINYTNVCTINCHFCSFYRTPGHKESYTQNVDQISERIVELERLGGCRILMQGGVNPSLPIEWYTELLEELSKRHPGISLDCFSPIEIEGIAEVSGLSTIEVLSRFRDSGLHGLPGGGAEMLVDSVRHGISPRKGSAENWLRVMSEAQSLGLITSATNVFGFGESHSERVEHMARIRSLQGEAALSGNPGFTSFVSWPVMLENNAFGKIGLRRNSSGLGASAVEYLRHVAVSRIFLHNVDHIQASWPTMGLEVAQIALSGGADDIGSTMMEENVVSASGTKKTMASVAELKETILQSGFVPALRDSEYNILEVTEVELNPLQV
ncbi:MAG: CofH family radical SAM protein [Candidatus Thalassarchaeaceae archaeon]|nr:CofH family radical SAM protein [Candidatus Thalassarchaeaceae archaeon]